MTASGTTGAAADSTRPDFHGRTIGIEEELLLVDPDSGTPLPVAERCLHWSHRLEAQDTTAHDATGLALGGASCRLASELQQEQVEVIHAPCSQLEDLTRSVMAGRMLADLAAQSAGARAAALACSVLPVQPHLMPGPRYRRMHEHLGALLTGHLTNGFHVHVSIGSPEEGVAALDRIRVWLPILLALTCNSPVVDGSDTGYASYRYQMNTRLPSAGPCDVFASVSSYRQSVQEWIRSRVLQDDAMIYYDARLSHRHPTVEIRVADVCMFPEHAAAVAALCRALVDSAVADWQDGRPPPPATRQLLLAADWAASRFGTESWLLHPLRNEPCSPAEAACALMGHVQDALEAYGDVAQVAQALDEILVTGSGARRQRSMARYGLQEVVKDAVLQTHRPLS